MAITFWGRKGDKGTVDAQLFLTANRYGADEWRDLDRDPPRGLEWSGLAKGLGGGLWPLVDERHPRRAEFQGNKGMQVPALQALLEADPWILKAPILLTPKGALAGFRERQWREFLDIGKGRG